MPTHKNKTFATLLALMLGTFGAHRYYLYGRRDRWVLLHLAAIPLSLLIRMSFPGLPGMFVLSPIVVSALVGVLEGMVIGLTPDDKWDAGMNPGSAKQSRSGWPLVILLVLGVSLGSVGLIWSIARTFDLLYTGGAYG